MFTVAVTASTVWPTAALCAASMAHDIGLCTVTGLDVGSGPVLGWMLMKP
jgi:hypothetical protein